MPRIPRRPATPIETSFERQTRARKLEIERQERKSRAGKIATQALVEQVKQKRSSERDPIVNAVMDDLRSAAAYLESKGISPDTEGNVKTDIPKGLRRKRGINEYYKPKAMWYIVSTHNRGVGLDAEGRIYLLHGAVAKGASGKRREIAPDPISSIPVLRGINNFIINSTNNRDNNFDATLPEATEITDESLNVFPLSLAIDPHDYDEKKPNHYALWRTTITDFVAEAVIKTT